MTAPFAFPFVLSILELSFLSSAFFKVFEDYKTRLVKLIFTVECGLCYPFSPFPLSPFFFNLRIMCLEMSKKKKKKRKKCQRISIVWQFGDSVGRRKSLKLYYLDHFSVSKVDWVHESMIVPLVLFFSMGKEMEIVQRSSETSLNA